MMRSGGDDGYRFGGAEVYCPWDVLNYCDLLRKNPKREPQNYRINTGSNEDLWRLLFATGYLTRRGEPDGNLLKLAIPNLEVRDVFAKQIREYFKESVKADTDTLDRFCAALRNGDAGASSPTGKPARATRTSWQNRRTGKQALSLR